MTMTRKTPTLNNRLKNYGWTEKYHYTPISRYLYLRLDNHMVESSYLLEEARHYWMYN